MSSQNGVDVKLVARREFLKYLSVAAGAGMADMIMPFRSWALITESQSRPFYLSWGGEVMLDRLNRSVFSDLLGSTFRINLDGSGIVDVELIKATDLPHDPGTAKREPFSLILRGPMEPVLAQSTYSFEHDTIGAFGMFIVPVGPDDKGMLYEAIFN